MTLAELYSIIFQSLDLILSFFAFIGSIIAIIFTYKNLVEMRKQLAEQKNQYFEQNRGNLVFYIAQNQVSIMHSLIIKNFGNSPAKLIYLKITPDLDWTKAGQSGIDNCNITNLKNVFLAPEQHISSGFDFRNYPDKSFEVEICYETCSKQFIETYSIDLDFIDRTLTMEPQIKDEVSALKNIYKAITSLSDKFI